MTCSTCQRPYIKHGSEAATGQPQGRATYAMESGCHDGVWMDDDVYGEGWQRDVIYPPCPCSPHKCTTCGKKPEAMTFHEWNTISYGTCVADDDCAECGGTGWKNGEPQWPTEVEPDEPECEAYGEKQLPGAPCPRLPEVNT